MLKSVRELCHEGAIQMLAATTLLVVIVCPPMLTAARHEPLSSVRQSAFSTDHHSLTLDKLGQPAHRVPEGGFVDKEGAYWVSVPRGWSISSEEYWDSNDPIEFDHRLELRANNGDAAMVLHRWRDRRTLDLGEMASLHLRPFLSSDAQQYAGTVQRNDAIVAAEPGIPGDRAGSIYVLFQCASSLYRIRYVGFRSGTRLAMFERILSSFRCTDQGLAPSAAAAGSYSFPAIPELEFVDLKSIESTDSRTCDTVWVDSDGESHTLAFNDPTANHYDCGQCVWWASYSRPDIPDDWQPEDPVRGRNNAHRWYDHAREHPGFEVSPDPEVGAVMVRDQSSTPGDVGHVAYVTWVNHDGSFYVTEMNRRLDGNIWYSKYRNRDDINFILGRVTLFEDPDFGGHWAKLGSDISDITYFLHHWEDEDGDIVSWDPSSVFIPSGWDTLFFKNTRYDPSSYRHRFGTVDGEPDFDELEASFWDLSLDYYSDGSNMDDAIGSARVANDMCFIMPEGLQGKQSVSGDPSVCGEPEPPSPLPPDEPRLGDDSARFLQDTSLPYGGPPVSPGQSLVKTWRVRNEGSTTWGSGYQLVFQSGDQMQAPSTVAVPHAGPGEVVDISVNLTAPGEGGDYRGNWRLRNPQGTYFGDELWVQITVPDQTDPPSPDQSPIELACTNCPAVVAPGETFRPTIRAAVNSGQLLESRGDMLRNTDGNLYGAWQHVSVVGAAYAGESYDFSFYADNPIVTPDSEGTYESKWQVWRDGSWAGDELTIRFDVEASGGTNYAPDPPTLTGPGDWAVYHGNSGITLEAQHNGDPDGDSITHYYFEIFESAQNANSGWIADNSWSPQGLGFNGYQWRAKVRDSQGNESDWSDDIWHFNILNDDPEIYDFHHETCREAWGGSDKICFCAETNAGTLKLQINTANDGSTDGEWHGINELGVPNYDCNTDDDHPPNLDPLPYADGTHVVRLYARREGGWANAAHEDITIDLPSGRKPDAPRLREPEHDIYLNSETVHFDWDATLRTTGYRIEASTSPDYGTLLIDETLSAETTEYEHTFSTDHETVYWRVTASGPHGTNRSSSRFHIDVDHPSSSASTLEDVTTDTKFSVNWGGSDARSGLRWYHVQVRSNDRGSCEWKDWLVSTTKTAAMFQAQPGHSYCFRVRAMDEVGNWEAWPVGEGDTCTLVDPSAIPSTAWWDTDYRHKRNLIILNNDDDAMPSGFPVHLQFDSTTTPSAAQIYDAVGYSSSGKDLRVVYNDTTERPRVLQSFSATEIDIWFPLQSSLGGGSTSSGDYQIYYGADAEIGDPPADVKDVFLPEADSHTMGLWHFQEGSGSAVHDASGRSHDGSFTSAAWADGLLGYAGHFNGTNAYVEMANHADLNLTAMTLEAWIYLTDSPEYAHVISKWGDDSAYFVRVMGDGRVQFQIAADGGNRDVTSGEALQQHRWYHVAGVHDGDNDMWVYVNGIERGHYGDSRTPFASTEPLRIGRDPKWSGTAFPGYIQHVRVSNVARHSFPYAKVDVEPSVEAGVSIAPPAQGSADLAVLALKTYPSPEGGLIAEAVVENQGARDTQNDFYTDLYADHVPAGEGDHTGSVRFWINTPIEAGATLTLTTVLTDGTGLDGVAAQSVGPQSPGSEITSTFYAQADSTGVVAEADDANNVYSPGVEVCFASADAYDEQGDDAHDAASLITVDETQYHNFDGPADQDWVKFQAQGGVTYTMSTSDLDTAADTYLYLYDTDGTTVLTSNDDYSSTLASRIDWQAPATGTYYLLVRHWNPSAGGCGTGYTLSLGESARVQLPSTIYLPMVARRLTVPLVTYSLAEDGEVGRTGCEDWDSCRNASYGSFAWSGYAWGSTTADSVDGGYAVKRTFLRFDTSALPAGARIRSAVLHVYSGQFQTSGTRVHVVNASQGESLSADDFDAVAFRSGGSVQFQPREWMKIQLNDLGTTWLAPGQITELALMHDLDLTGTAPTEGNGATMALHESGALKPYLTIDYVP